MILSFKDRLTNLFEGNDILLATTKFGDIKFVDNMLVVPVDVEKFFTYDFVKDSWTQQWASIIFDKSNAPQIDVIGIELKVVDNKIFELFTDSRNELKLEYYRLARNEYCYPIINRGKLWYDHLKSWQVNDLNWWYEAWLDVTETIEIPTEPEWLNNKLHKLDEEEIF